jgi:acyl-CoA thioester hydrolase
MDYIRKVNYYETDNMGIVHHSNYIRYFEEARVYMMAEVGLPYDKVEQAGVLIPVLECECKYIKSATFAMDLLIETTITSFDGVRMTIEYAVKALETKELLATGFTKHCFLNADFKPVRLKRDFTDMYEKLKALTE